MKPVLIILTALFLFSACGNKEDHSGDPDYIRPSYPPDNISQPTTDPQ